MKRILPFIISLCIVIAVVYMLGPKASIEKLDGEYPPVPTELSELENYIRQKEDTVTGLKPETKAKIIWGDSLHKSKTPYSIIYIHGFGASEMEGSPVNRLLAEHFGANLYLARLPEHGIIRPDAMRHITAQKLMAGNREAYMIGKSLGDSVIVVGTSMGGALALALAAERPEIKAVVLYSPAIEERGRSLQQFFEPWKIYLAENFIYENGMRITPREEKMAKYWSEEYHVNAYVSLVVLLRSKMTAKTFGKIEQPLFLGYYYKSEQEKDFVVSVPKMLEMFDQIKTPDHLKVKEAFPETGDHVIASHITSDDWESVLNSTIRFLEDVAKVRGTAVGEELVEVD